MSSVPTRVRVAARYVALLSAGALLLASCATTSVASERLSGTPSLSISVPLSNVGCTTHDVCLTLGTSSASIGPTSVGEFSTPRGRWRSLALPASASPLVTSIACSSSNCLVGGSQPSGDLLWRFDATAYAVRSASPPPGGIGVDALNCEQLDCQLVDTSAQTGVPRFSFSADGGQTWTNPLSMSWAKGATVTAVSCGAVFYCLVAASSPGHSLMLYDTNDGGVTWSERTTPRQWTTMSSLSCVQLRCVGLVGTAHSSLLVRSTSFALTWTHVSLAQRASALACSTWSSCVVVGQRTSGTPWLATVRASGATSASLRYVPTTLLGVGCGTKRCVAIGVTTVVNVPLVATRGS